MQAIFIIPPKTHLLDITGPATIFYEASCYGTPVQSTFSSIFINQFESDSSCNLSFYKLIPYGQLELTAEDLIFIPGIDYMLLSDTAFLDSCKPFLSWLNMQHSKGVIVCSVCTGAFLLAEAGLLDRRNCTTHWRYAERLKKRYPNVKFQANRLFVHEDNIYTSAGITSGIDLALYLTEQFWGPYIAAQVAKEAVIYFRRTLDDPQLNVFIQYRNHINHRIHNVQDAMVQSLGQKLNIDELANKANMSTRNLTRLFKKTTGITIGAYLNQLRSEHAKKLIENGHTLKAAASHCGLKSTNQMRTLLENDRKKILQ